MEESGRAGAREESEKKGEEDERGDKAKETENVGGDFSIGGAEEANL